MQQRKKITSQVNQFNTTEQAFADLISRSQWYVGIKIDGFPITMTNASQIKRRFLGKTGKRLSIEMMEGILTAAGYKIVQPLIWEK